MMEPFELDNGTELALPRIQHSIVRSCVAATRVVGMFFATVGISVGILAALDHHPLEAAEAFFVSSGALPWAATHGASLSSPSLPRDESPPYAFLRRRNTEHLLENRHVASWLQEIDEDIHSRGQHMTLGGDNLSKATWTMLGDNHLMPKVSGQAAAVDEVGGRVLLFGGLKDGSGSPTTNDLWQFVVAAGTWHKLETVNEGPSPRMYATAALLGRRLYVIGGWDPNLPGSVAFNDDIWRLDVDTLNWTYVDSIPFGQVSRHAAVTVGPRVVVSTSRGVFTVEADETIIERPTIGDGPVSYFMPAAAPLGVSSMLIFAGSSKTERMTTDVWRLDTEKYEWTKLKTYSAVTDSPTPLRRASPCATPVDGRSVLMFGGSEGGLGLRTFNDAWMLRVDGDMGVWEEVITDESIGVSTKPDPRVGATLSSLPGGNRFLLQGGWDPKSKQTFDKSYVLTL
eukprot:TRINITY_DN21403_c0_g2_i1.p1 TRINITY_DN21403_c0_g2~~TRINITY_DN21403_c0_g2_i1.p1  ORF type:complete len:455 (+),score=43.25 TRINITY_DN21403_c0_g2_i1:55-1419(+)